MKPIKRILAAIKNNYTEYYIGLLLVFGVPLIGLLYADLRLFIALSVITQSIIGILYLRKGK